MGVISSFSSKKKKKKASRGDSHLPFHATSNPHAGAKNHSEHKDLVNIQNKTNSSTESYIARLGRKQWRCNANTTKAAEKGGQSGTQLQNNTSMTLSVSRDWWSDLGKKGTLYAPQPISTFTLIVLWHIFA